MLWHLNRFRDAKQGINLFKTYITNINRGNKLEKFYKDLLTAWADLTNNENVDSITLPEIYKEPLFLILVRQRQLWHSCHKHKYKRYIVIFRNYILYGNIFIMRKHVFNWYYKASMALESIDIYSGMFQITNTWYSRLVQIYTLSHTEITKKPYLFCEKLSLFHSFTEVFLN